MPPDIELRGQALASSSAPITDTLAQYPSRIFSGPCSAYAAERWRGGADSSTGPSCSEVPIPSIAICGGEARPGVSCSGQVRRWPVAPSQPAACGKISGSFREYGCYASHSTTVWPTVRRDDRARRVHSGDAAHAHDAAGGTRVFEAADSQDLTSPVNSDFGDAHQYHSKSTMLQEAADQHVDGGSQDMTCTAGLLVRPPEDVQLPAIPKFPRLGGAIVYMRSAGSLPRPPERRRISWADERSDPEVDDSETDEEQLVLERALAQIESQYDNPQEDVLPMPQVPVCGAARDSGSIIRAMQTLCTHMEGMAVQEYVAQMRALASELAGSEFGPVKTHHIASDR